MVRYLAQTTPADEVQVRDWTGDAIPLHVTPSGLVMLAYAPEAEVAKILAEDLARFTDSTVTDPDVHPRRLAAIRTTRQHLAGGRVLARCHLRRGAGVRRRTAPSWRRSIPTVRRTVSPVSGRPSSWPAMSAPWPTASASACGHTSTAIR